MQSEQEIFGIIAGLVAQFISEMYYCHLPAVNPADTFFNMDIDEQWPFELVMSQVEERFGVLIGHSWLDEPGKINTNSTLRDVARAVFRLSTCAQYQHLDPFIVAD